MIRQMTAFNVAAYTQKQQAIAMDMAKKNQEANTGDTASATNQNLPASASSQDQNVQMCKAIRYRPKHKIRRNPHGLPLPLKASHCNPHKWLLTTGCIWPPTKLKPML